MQTVTRIHYEIPDDLHRQIKAAAAMRGQSLKDYVTEALARSLEAERTGENEKG